MRNVQTALIIMLAVVLPAAGTAYAQSSQGSGKMYCWKNKTGKTECGDKVPYEYQDAAIRELNKQGVVTSRTESSTPEERKAREVAEEKRRVEAAQKEDQRRKDKALLDTFSNEKEIDLKRVRDVQLLESNIDTLQSNLKNMIERQTDARTRADQYAKDKRPVPQPIQDEIDRVNSEKADTERQIAQKRKDIVELNQRYDGLKKRYAELTGIGNSAGGNTKPAPAVSVAPVKK